MRANKAARGTDAPRDPVKRGRTNDSNEAKLASSLAELQELHALHADLAVANDLHPALCRIVVTACKLLGTDRGCIQLASEDGERLEMYAYHGYCPDDLFIQHFLHEGSKPACDAARSNRQRLIIEDVATFVPLLDTRDREIALADSIRATQSTPMITRSGTLIGVLSNQFRAPHRPSEHALQMIDMLAWTAADFVARHRAQAKLQEEQTRMQTLLGGIAQAFWETGADGRTATYSPTWHAYTGQTWEEWQGEGWVGAVHPDDRDYAIQQWRAAVAAKRNVDAEFRLRNPDDDWCWTNVRAAPVLNADGSVRKWVGMNVDITAKKLVQIGLHERLSKIISQAATGVVEANQYGQMTLVNQKFCDMLGYAEEELLGKTVIEITAPDSAAATLEGIQGLAGGGADFVIEKHYRRKDGSLLSAESSVNALRGSDNSFQGIVAIVVDISARRLAEDKLRHASMHDSLTGLPNRAMLFEYAGRLLPFSQRTNRCSAVLFLDLDRFKPVNDSHGHETGDKVLKEVAQRLSGSLRAEDMVARLGGDEFIVLLQDIGAARYAADLARYIISRISEPYLIGELSLSVSASIGISIFPQDGASIEELIGHSDMALYQAKQSGRNNFQFFSPDYAAAVRMQLAIEKKLKEAISNEAFHLYYQPVVDIETGKVVSAEALLRWKDSDIGPERFVPVAEATGMINPIGKWLMRQASRQYRAWREAGLPSVPIAVNVSAVEFRDPDFANRLRRILDEEGLEPGALQLEVTETAVMEDIDHAIVVLSILKGLGVKILLDDFGTGYSSLSYLAKLPLNKVKIDKSFVSLAANEIASRAVTNAMIVLGRTLGLEVVAEGVESASALEFVRLQGCDQVQGFLIARPMSGGAFKDWYFDTWHHHRV